MNIKNISTLIILFVLLISCKTSKDLLYFQNAENNAFLEGIPKDAPVYTILPNDNLFVDIQTSNAELSALFDFAKQAGTPSSQSNYGGLSAQYLNGYHVDLSGYINLPLIGKIFVEGLTAKEIEEQVQKRADEFIKDATVKCLLLNYKVSVLGEVKAPGVYYNYNSSLTVLEALSMAGGLTDYGKMSKVLVVRPTVKGTRSFYVDLTNNEFLSSKAYFLLPNDLVIVQPDKNKSLSMNTSFYSLLLSSISTFLLIFNVIK